MGNRYHSTFPPRARITRVKNNHFKHRQDFQDLDLISVNMDITQAFWLKWGPVTSLLAVSEQTKLTLVCTSNSVLVKVCSTHL